MKRAIPYIVVCAFASVMLSGCLDLEGTRLSIDLKEERAEVVYLNIVSGAEIVSSAESEEAMMEEDLQDLLQMAYEEKGDTLEVSLVSSELYEENGQLNGRQMLHIKDMELFLGQYKIKKDYRGYIMELDEDTTYNGGNGIYIESSAGRQVFWDKDATLIKAELVTDISGKDSTSMLPYWKEWKKWDAKKGADIPGLVVRDMEEGIDTMPEENTLDYCPDDTCYSFTAELRSPGAYNRLSDFVAIYLYQIMDDSSLDGFRAAVKKDLPGIVSRNMRNCPNTSSVENAKCAMRNIASTYSVKLKKIEYEELEKQETPIDLKEVLE